MIYDNWLLEELESDEVRSEEVKCECDKKKWKMKTKNQIHFTIKWMLQKRYQWIMAKCERGTFGSNIIGTGKIEMKQRTMNNG